MKTKLLLFDNHQKFYLTLPFFAPLRRILVLTILCVLTAGCALIPPREQPDCKIQAYVGSGIIEFASTRYRMHLPIRMGILPFLVPENFAPGANSNQNFAYDLAKSFQNQVIKTGQISIVELFDFSLWPGRRDDFYFGNYQALQSARTAGYDLLLVGQFQQVTNDKDLVINTKVIDVINGVTLWYGTTTVTSYARQDRRLMSSFEVIPDRPDLFSFPQRTAELVRCTVEEGMLKNPEEDLPNDESWF